MKTNTDIDTYVRALMIVMMVCCLVVCAIMIAVWIDTGSWWALFIGLGFTVPWWLLRRDYDEIRLTTGGQP